MNQKIYLTALEKFKELFKNYRFFRNVFLDDWRGYRFVYDSEEIEKYPGKNFIKSKLYSLLKNQKTGLFSAGLIYADAKDKRLFGEELFLNCKTFRQYQNCYINFLLKRVNSKRKFLNEMKLIDGCRIIYSKKYKNLLNLEKNFRTTIFLTVYNKSDKVKRA